MVEAVIDSKASPEATRPSWWRRRSPLTRVGLVVVAGLVLAAGVRRALLPPFPRWAEIEPRALYRSALLEPDDLERAVRRYGIRTVVTLRPHHDDMHYGEVETLRGLGIPLVEIPIRPTHPPSDSQVDHLRDLFDDPARLPILVHCRHGNIRAAGVEAFYRREYLGEDAATALENASRFGHDLAVEAPRIKRFIEDLPSGIPRRMGSRVERERTDEGAVPTSER